MTNTLKLKTAKIVCLNKSVGDFACIGVSQDGVTQEIFLDRATLTGLILDAIPLLLSQEMLDGKVS